MVVLATLATLFSVMGLTSCVGYTGAAGTQPASTGLLTPSATSLSFGNIATGGTSIQTVTITNTGTAAASISHVTISGTGLAVIGGNPTGSIAVGQSSTVQVQFAPLTAGSVTGSMIVTSNAANSPLRLSITGTGTQGVLTMSPASVSFGNVSVGQSGAQSVRLSNTGTSSTTISSAGAIGAGYSISGLSAGQVIGAGQNISFTTSFNPAVSGATTGTVSITSNLSATPTTIGLTGMGTQASITANPSSASFGNVVMGNKNSQSITLTNSGNTTLTFSQITVSGSGFSVTGVSTSTTIPAGGNAAFSVAFAPTSQTAVQGSIVLTTNGSPSQLTIPLSGSGAAATTQLSSNPTSLAFGNVSVNGSSTLTSVLTNTGNSNVTLSNVTVVGTGLSASGVSIGLMLQPGQSANLTVSFAPKTIGSLAAANVTVTSNASPVTIGVTGAGAQHSVALSWNASTSSGLSGYYVYRSATSGTGYGRLNSGLPVSATTTQFADASVQAGQTYYYVVTAVNSSNVESADSNQMTAIIP
jgi:Abnormal spindle-like microcephaly-assoc'd, ASPM-SPD-2-Hydin/Protein of unknown function (DUF1573)